MSILSNKKILVAGVGSTGQEILKILSKIECQITILDYDTVMLTDLNRQLFSRTEDIGKKKVHVLQKYFLEKYDKKIKIIENNLFELFELEYYEIIFCCFDNIESRMQLNHMIAENDKIQNNTILIDMGIENLFVHAKKVIFKKTSCLYCIKDLYLENKKRNICTLKSNKTREDKIYNLSQKFNIEETIEIFNKNNEKKTNEFEIIGIKDNVIPNVCYIASIAASFAFILLNSEYDFCFYNGQICRTEFLNLERDKNCISCGESE